MSTSRVFCSDLASDSAMSGTAEHVDAWLLLEYKPSWPGKAIEEGQLAQSTKSWLQQTQAEFAAAGLKLRPQLVRQPELDRDSTRLLLSLRGRIYEFSGTGYDFLQDLDLLGLVQAGKETSQPVAAPRYFVCTNGKRDLCCSRYGLPVYQRLRELVGDRVWQVTHLGGHRFAPNVLVAPQNILYGRVAVDALDAFVEQIEQDRVAFPYLRGRTEYPQPVQAAEAFVAEQGLRLLHVNDLPVSQRQESLSPAAAERSSSITTEVDFAGVQKRFRVQVRRAATPEMIQGSCGDTATKPYYPFEMLA